MLVPGVAGKDQCRKVKPEDLGLVSSTSFPNSLLLPVQFIRAPSVFLELFLSPYRVARLGERREGEGGAPRHHLRCGSGTLDHRSEHSISPHKLVMPSLSSILSKPRHCMLGRGRLDSGTAFSSAHHNVPPPVPPPAELAPCLACRLGERQTLLSLVLSRPPGNHAPSVTLPPACKIKKYLQLKGEQLQRRLGEEEEKLESPEGVLFGSHTASSGRDPRGRGCPSAQGYVWQLNYFVFVGLCGKVGCESSMVITGQGVDMSWACL